MASLKGRRRGAGLLPVVRSKGTQPEDKLGEQWKLLKRTDGINRLERCRLAARQYVGSEPEATHLQGHGGGRPAEGSLTSEAYAEELCQ